ncbi:MAG: PilZ protein [Moraxellaceae bacterium]|jgi:hypothetical protein|nr:PilZ protein [Moraxellaceae bacterium]MDF3031508.1 PilZ protein [Moraxellaceae bacterium]
MTSAQQGPVERRRATRVNSDLALAYQIITAREAECDPYDPRFSLPHHFTLSQRLQRVDDLVRDELDDLRDARPELGLVLDTVSEKLDILARAIEGSIGQLVSPAPKNVNLSESGLSFHAEEPVMPGTLLHLAISNTRRNYHIAAIGRAVYCEEEDLEGYRTGVAFLTLRDEDRQVLARDIIRKVQENAVIEDFLNPENG